MGISNYIERKARDEDIVTACDAGEAYAVIGRQFDLTGGTVAQIYHRECRRRAHRNGQKIPGHPWTREALLGTRAPGQGAPTTYK